jgi:hypothetical protein
MDSFCSPSPLLIIIVVIRIFKIILQLGGNLTSLNAHFVPVCVCVYVCVNVYARVRVCVCVYVCVNVYSRVYVCVNVYARVCVCVCVYVRARALVYICVSKGASPSIAIFAQITLRLKSPTIKFFTQSN